MASSGVAGGGVAHPGVAHVAGVAGGSVPGLPGLSVSFGAPRPPVAPGALVCLSSSEVSSVWEVFPLTSSGRSACPRTQAEHRGASVFSLKLR